jgi:hypothetical protein
MRDYRSEPGSFLEVHIFLIAMEEIALVLAIFLAHVV